MALEKLKGKNVFSLVRAALSAAINEVCGCKEESPPLIPFAKSDEFDYQSAFAQKLYPQHSKSDSTWKERFNSPVQLAELVGRHVCEQNPELLKSYKVSENGFLLLLLGDELLLKRLNDWLTSGVAVANDPNPQKVIVDFSSPNIAKEMHAGHLRSTIIGESISRVLEAQGHNVKRCNHVGDWGTQFGMLIAHLFEVFPDFIEKKPNLKDLETFYRESKKKFDADPEFKERAHQCVVRLQTGEKDCLDGWKKLCDISREFYTQIYLRLDITIEEMGESFYNPFIPGVIDEVREKGLTCVDKGAVCMYLPGKKVPLMIVKSDGGYNYDSTDLAAVWYRLKKLQANRVIYVTDVGQYPHFASIFAAAKLADWVGEARLDHMGFGLVLNEQGERMATRAGKSVKLMELLDEARDRAKQELTSRVENEEEGRRRTQLSSAEFDAAAETLGVAGIKYYDLRQNRVQDYKLNFDAMLNQKGDTAIYLMYSYIRVCSILRRSEFDLEALRRQPLQFTHAQERLLARHLVKFDEMIEAVVDNLTLNRICEFLYVLASKVAESYNVYKVLGNEESEQRLRLVLVVKDMMALCFHLLSIKTIDRI